MTTYIPNSKAGQTAARQKTPGSVTRTAISLVSAPAFIALGAMLMLFDRLKAGSTDKPAVSNAGPPTSNDAQ